jgi:GDSL-like lipase/acylhydrolase family protein
MPPRIRTRNEKRRISLAIWLGSLLVAEGAARLAFPPKIPEMVPSANPRLIYELNPEYPGVNSRGMRQGEIDASALARRFVVAVIGDSHAYSVGSPHPAQSFPARLEHHLNATGERAAVLNFGVQGYNMVQELEVLQAKALPFAPDLVVLQYCINDDHISNYIQPRFPAVNRAIHHSVLLTTAWTTFLYSNVGRTYVLPYADHATDFLLFAPGLVGTPVSREQGTSHGFTHPTRSTELVPSRYHDFIGRENFERAVKAFGEICQRRGIRVVATGFIEQDAEAFYERSGFLVYSFFTMFQGLDMRRYGYDPNVTDGHFSPQGNDFIAQALATYIDGHLTLERGR